MLRCCPQCSGVPLALWYSNTHNTVCNTVKDEINTFTESNILPPLHIPLGKNFQHLVLYSNIQKFNNFFS